MQLPSLQSVHVLVVGDVMLDRYWRGPARRVSPEAPVPVIDVEQVDERPGGAANVALNVASLGARVTLVAGPVHLPTPAGVTRVDVVTARDMAAACEAALPADIAVMVAAVADWRAETAPRKLKKDSSAPAPLVLTENPDILAGIGHHAQRPALVVGFAAETHDLIPHAAAKRTRKGADWIVANDVSEGVFGSDSNHVHPRAIAGDVEQGH